jgi:hypothetical protein
MGGVRARSIVLLIVALAAGVVASYFLASQARPRKVGDDADYYCYELRQAWVCAYARAECEARLAREVQADVLKRCMPHTDVPLTP